MAKKKQKAPRGSRALAKKLMETPPPRSTVADMFKPKQASGTLAAAIEWANMRGMSYGGANAAEANLAVGYVPPDGMSPTGLSAPRPTQAKAIADLADRTHDARAPRPRAPIAPVPGRAGEYVQDFGQLDGIIAREARKRSARDDREGVY